MAAPPDHSIINKVRYDASACDQRINGRPMLFVEWSDKFSRTIGEVEAANTPWDAGTTTGKAKANASLTLLEDEADKWEETLGEGFMEEKFTVVNTYKKTGGREKKDEFFRCEIVDREKGVSPDGKAIVVKYSLYVAMAKFNGRWPLKDVRL